MLFKHEGRMNTLCYEPGGDKTLRHMLEMRLRKVNLRIKVKANSSLAEGALVIKERRCLFTIVHSSLIRGKNVANILTNKLKGALRLAAMKLV